MLQWCIPILFMMRLLRWYEQDVAKRHNSICLQGLFIMVLSEAHKKCI